MRATVVEVGTGVRLAVAEAGAGGRPLLLVHSYGGAKEDFADTMTDLAGRGWHAVAPDLRGHGASDWPEAEGAYSLEHFAADLAALADARGWDRYAVYGHSMGGMAAQCLALAGVHRDRLAGLVLADTAHGPLEWLDPQVVAAGVAVVRAGGVPALVEALDALAQAGGDDGVTTTAHLRLLAERPGYAEYCRRKALATAAPMRLAMMPAFLSTPDRLDALRSLAVPTLVLVGEHDGGFVGHARRLAGAVPGARLAVVPAAGHSPHVEAPEAWWAALDPFLDGLARSWPGRHG